MWTVFLLLSAPLYLWLAYELRTTDRALEQWRAEDLRGSVAYYGEPRDHSLDWACCRVLAWRDR